MSSREKFEAWMTAEQWFHGSDFEWDEHRNCYAQFGIHLAYKAFLAAEGAAEQKLTDMAVQLANAESKCRELAAENGRYSMSAGQADQRMSESLAVREALGFNRLADDVSPSDLVDKIKSIIAECDAIRSAHPQPLGPVMDAAIDAFNAEEMPETGMLNAYFILRDSITVQTPQVDAFLAEVRASAISEYADKRGFSFQNGSIHAHLGNGDVMVGATKFETGHAGICFAPVRDKTGVSGTEYAWTEGKNTEEVGAVFVISSSSVEGLEVIHGKIAEAIAQLRQGAAL